MSKRLVLLLVVAAVLLTFCSAVLSRRDSRDWRANRSRRLLPFPWQDTVSITIAKTNGDDVRLAKNAHGEWRIRLPGDLDDSLSYRAVDELAALATMTWREPLSEAGALSVDPVVLTATSAAGQKVELTFGGIRNNLRSVVVDGDSGSVYGVNQDLLQFLDWSAERFRNYYLASGGGTRPKRVVLAPKGDDEDLKIVMERHDAAWRLIRPVSWAVDETRLDMLLQWIERLRAESIEAEMTGDAEWFGFGPDSAFVEVVYECPAGEIERRVEFGGDAGDGRLYARVKNRNPVFAVSGTALGEISLDVASEHQALWKNFYRRRTINLIGDELPEAFVIERLLPEPRKLTLEQIRDRDVVRWRGRLETTSGVHEFPVDPPDANERMRPLTALITGLSTLRIKAFHTDSAPGPDTVKWTAYPAWRFICKRPGGLLAPALTLYAADADGLLPPGAPFVPGDPTPQPMTPMSGMPQNVGIAFSIDNQPAVMEMVAELSYLLCLPLYRYQSHKVIDYDPRFWGKVEIAKSGETRVFFRQPGEVNEQWWLDSADPQPLMDDNNRFVAVLTALSQLHSDGFVEETTGDIAKIGLDQPEITAIVYTSVERAAPDRRDSPLFKLEVGRAGPLVGTRYARLNGEGPVFLVSGRVAEGLGDIYR